LQFSDLIRDNKLNAEVFGSSNEYEEHINTPGMGDGSMTSMHWAAKVGSKPWTVKILLEYGADQVRDALRQQA
jgi:hypothetical protein